MAHEPISRRLYEPVSPLTSPSVIDVPRLLERRAARKQARLLSGRNRRRLVGWLRTICARGHEPDPIARRHSVLLHYRVAHSRTDMLWIAAALERTHNPDPACLTLLHNLLANPTGDSPLYNPHVPASQLEAILQELRDGLDTQAADLDSLDPEPRR
jgi:hypothetical protein